MIDLVQSIFSRPAAQDVKDVPEKVHRASMKSIETHLEQGGFAVLDELTETTISFSSSESESPSSDQRSEDTILSTEDGSISFDFGCNGIEGCDDLSGNQTTCQTYHIQGRHALSEGSLSQAAPIGNDANISIELTKLGFPMVEKYHTCKALKILLSTLELRCHRHGSSHPSVAHTWNEIGNLYLDCDDVDKARSAYQQAINCKDSKEVAEAHSNMGMMYLRWNDVDRSIALVEKARDLLASVERCNGLSSTESLDMAMIFHRLGVACTRNGYFPNAKESLMKALNIRVVACGPGDVLVGKTHDAMGKLNFAEGNIESAMDSHVKALGIFFAATEESRASVACLENIATVCCELNEYERALKSLTRRMQLQSNSLAKCQVDPERQHLVAREVSGIIYSVKRMADVHELRGCSIEARQWVDEANRLSDSLTRHEECRHVGKR
jgi:tetratricopeptide (TPR) repeat protein